MAQEWNTKSLHDFSRRYSGKATNRTAKHSSTLGAFFQSLIHCAPQGIHQCYDTVIHHHVLACLFQQQKCYAEWLTVFIYFAFNPFIRAQQFERRKNAGAGFQVSTTEEEHKLWESESNTWLLLETLFRCASGKSLNWGQDLPSETIDYFRRC